jgi:hypothetical protein
LPSLSAYCKGVRPAFRLMILLLLEIGKSSK